MWGATEVPDQAEGYASSLLLRAKLTEKEKFNHLRATSVTVAGIRAYGRSAMHPFRPTKPMIRNGCIALHYYVHFLRIFSFVTRGIESEGVGARSGRCTTPFV